MRLFVFRLQTQKARTLIYALYGLTSLPQNFACHLSLESNPVSFYNICCYVEVFYMVICLRVLPRAFA